MTPTQPSRTGFVRTVAARGSPPPGSGSSSPRRRAPSAGKPEQEVYHMSTIGAKIDQLHALREQKRALEEQIKQLSKQMDVLENALIDQMDTEGVSKSTGNAATVSITTSVKPSV